MPTERYVCLICDKGHDLPGLCPHCPRGELLDTTIDSDRELLDDRRNIKQGRRREILFVFLIIAVCGIVPAGAMALLEGLLGWSSESAGLLVLVILLAALVPGVVWVNRISRPQKSQDVEPVERAQRLDDAAPPAEVSRHRPVRKKDLS